MKGYRFYEEFPSSYKKRRRRDTCGNVIAIYVDALPYCSGCAFMLGAVAAMFGRPNSDVGYTAVDVAYLRLNCRRIPEKRAREIHPNLFAYLDRDTGEETER